MSDLHTEFLALLAELGGILGNLTGIARKKVEATRQGDLEVLNQCMKEEQVFTLSLKTLERKRAGMLSQLQLEQVPLNQLWEHYPQGMKGQARETIEDLHTQYQAYESAATAARTIMERALRDIERMMPENQAPPPRGSPQKAADGFQGVARGAGLYVPVFYGGQAGKGFYCRPGRVGVAA